MTEYLLIGGPAHGVVKTITESRRVLLPDHAAYIEKIAYGEEPAPTSTPLVAYAHWDIPQHLARSTPDLAVMKVEGMPDEDALAALAKILRPRFDAIESRLREQHSAAAMDEFRAFLDQWEDRPLPAGAWRGTDR